MKIKLISCSYGGHRPIVLGNRQEIHDLGVDIVTYDDTDAPTRENAMHPRLKGKIPKMLEWNKGGDYDYYIWIDSKFTLKEGALTKLLSYCEGYDLCLFPHPDRGSIKEEYEFMATLMNQHNSYLLERYTGEDMKSQINMYLSDETYVDDKLFSCGCFVYHKNLVENKDYNLMKEWFYHNAAYTVQDQLSLPFLLQKFKTNYNVYDFNIIHNDIMKHG